MRVETDNGGSRSVFVAGQPRPQGSKTMTPHGGIREASPYLKAWRKAITLTVLGAGWHRDPLIGPVDVQLDFQMERPKHHYTKTGLRPNAPWYHTIRPDIDKLIRAVLDALTDAMVYADDADVAVIGASKHYAAKPGVQITLRQADTA